MCPSPFLPLSQQMDVNYRQGPKRPGFHFPSTACTSDRWFAAVSCFQDPFNNVLTSRPSELQHCLRHWLCWRTTVECYHISFQHLRRSVLGAGLNGPCRAGVYDYVLCHTGSVYRANVGRLPPHVDPSWSDLCVQIQPYVWSRGPAVQQNANWRGCCCPRNASHGCQCQMILMYCM